MGEDITAPAGAEWFSAWKLEKSILPLRWVSRRTPAAQTFLRGIPVQWTLFYTGNELARIVTLDLIRILNHPQNRYGLNVTELELLELHRQRAQAATGTTRPIEPGGAEGGGVLLDLGHREPVTGVVLGEG